MINNPGTITQYIASQPKELRARLKQLRETIRKAAPKATEKLAWDMPTFVFEGNLVHFACHKHHIGFYPAPSAIVAFKALLAGYKGAKGSVQFPHDEPLPLGLITKMVKFRVKENLADAKPKALKKAKKRASG